MSFLVKVDLNVLFNIHTKAHGQDKIFIRFLSSEAALEYFVHRPFMVCWNDNNSAAIWDIILHFVPPYIAKWRERFFRIYFRYASDIYCKYSSDSRVSPLSQIVYVILLILYLFLYCGDGCCHSCFLLLL